MATYTGHQFLLCHCKSLGTTMGHMYLYTNEFMWGFDVYHLLSMYSTVYCTMDTLKAQLGTPMCISFNIYLKRKIICKCYCSKYFIISQTWSRWLPLEFQ